VRPGPGRFLRRLASLLVRGPDAPFVLGDLEETLSRDLARGVWPRRARWRYLRNAVASASRLARARARGSWRGRRRGFGALGVSWLDVKLGLRMLVKAPLLTAVSIVSLGVGIPVGLAPGQIIDALETTLPVEGGDRIEILRYRSVETSGVVLPTSYDLGVWREALGSFETLAAVRLVEHNVDSGNDAAAPVVGAELTPSTFGILEARPLLGRMLDGGDAVPGAPPVVVLGEDLWRARMAGDSGAVGRTVRISGEPHTVVGIMPSDFGFPVRQQMWLPLEALPASEPGDGIRMQVFGRLAEGATREIAEGELATVLRRLGAELPETHRLLVAEVAPFTAAGWMGQPEGSLRGATTGIWLMQMPSLLLLMVACVNVGLLVFARAATRSEELAVRTALGASRGVLGVAHAGGGRARHGAVERRRSGLPAGATGAAHGRAAGRRVEQAARPGPGTAAPHVRTTAGIGRTHQADSGCSGCLRARAQDRSRRDPRVRAGRGRLACTGGGERPVLAPDLRVSPERGRLRDRAGTGRNDRVALRPSGESLQHLRAHEPIDRQEGLTQVHRTWTG